MQKKKKKKATKKRQKVRGKNWKRSIKIDDKKFKTVSAAILKSLKSTPMRFTEVVNSVKKRLKKFAGSIDWYTIVTLRELESQKKVKRHKKKPVVYSKK